MAHSNGHVVMLKRPGKAGAPTDDCFGYESCEMPNKDKLTSGQVIVKSCYLSVDPALRCCMNEETGVHYLTPWQIGKTIDGAGGIGVVEWSASDNFSTGDLVITKQLSWPWKYYWLATEDMLQKVDFLPPGIGPNMVINYLGLIGLTVLLGIEEKGHIDPVKRPCFVVSGAAGACGSIAGQIARILGCTKIVGICGSDEKCRVLKEELSFDHAINYKTENVAQKVKEFCPEGVGCYFDNVGGDVSDAVVENMCSDSHVVLCGQISQYNKDVPYPPPINPKIEEIMKTRNITRERFLVLNYQEKYDAALKQLAEWLLTGKIKVKENRVEGLENAGKAFVGMMNGENVGKQLVHVSDP